MPKRMSLIGLLAALLLSGCAIPLRLASTPTEAPPTPTGIPTSWGKLSGLTFHLITYKLGPWPEKFGPYYPAIRGQCTRDATGICILIWNGSPYQQPVSQAQDGLDALVRYQSGQGAEFLTRAKNEAARLVKDHVTYQATGDSWWFPYMFTIKEYNNASQVAIPPWFSGMAQGAALQLFTELYMLTHDSSWANAARKTFESFLYPYKQASVPWVVHLDNGYLWIEEYPEPNPNDHTINGFGYALWGIIDYAREFKDQDATELAQAGLTTFYYAATLAEKPGGISSYSLAHPQHRPIGYHRVVTQQLSIFGFVTGDARFTALSQAFARDAK